MTTKEQQKCSVFRSNGPVHTVTVLALKPLVEGPFSPGDWLSNDCVELWKACAKIA